MFVMWSPSPPSSLSLNLGVGGRGGSLKIRRPPLAVRACMKSMYTQMPVFVLPIRQEGFYAPRLCRRPISDPPSFGATFLINLGQNLC